MVSPLFQYRIGGFDLYVFGHQPHLTEKGDISYQQAVELGANPEKIAQVITASGPADKGHKEVYPANYTTVLRSDGIILREVGSAGIIKTGDCIASLFCDENSGDGALVHMGRSALDPTKNDCSTCAYTVIDNALALLTRHQSNAHVQALVTGSICGSCFKHEGPDAQHHIDYFRRLPGVFADESTGALDLFAVAQHNLTHVGVPAEHIKAVGPCTFETPELSSYRRGDKTRNTFIAIKRA